MDGILMLYLKQKQGNCPTKIAVDSEKNHGILMYTNIRTISSQGLGLMSKIFRDLFHIT